MGNSVYFISNLKLINSMKTKGKDGKEMLYYWLLLLTDGVRENCTNPNVSLKHCHKIREGDVLS